MKILWGTYHDYTRQVLPSDVHDGVICLLKESKLQSMFELLEAQIAMHSEGQEKYVQSLPWGTSREL
jgi:hypothetical protein